MPRTHNTVLTALILSAILPIRPTKPSARRTSASPETSRTSSNCSTCATAAGRITAAVAENIAVLVDFLMAKLSLTREDATLLHIEMWAYVHGIAVLCASGQQNWDDALISRMLTDGFEGIKSRFQKNEQ